MEFTKAENKILSPRYEKWGQFVLCMGVVALCCSLALGLYHYYDRDKERKSFEEIELKAERIQPTTERETKLKALLVRTMAGEKGYMLKYLEARIFVIPSILFLTGIDLIAAYFMRRRFMKLIRKLQRS